MKEFIKKLLQQERNSNKKAIPLDVKEAFGLVNDEDYDKKDVNSSVKMRGIKAWTHFSYCIAKIVSRKFAKVGSEIFEPSSRQSNHH